MIGKLKKGSSFGGCIRYVTGKDEAKIIASDCPRPFCFTTAVRT